LSELEVMVLGANPDKATLERLKQVFCSHDLDDTLALTINNDIVNVKQEVTCKLCNKKRIINHGSYRCGKIVSGDVFISSKEFTDRVKLELKKIW